MSPNPDDILDQLYAHVGHVTNYNPEVRSVRWAEVVEIPSPSAFLKLYGLQIDGSYLFEKDDYSAVADFLSNEINGGVVDVLSGLGFAMISEDTLNVSFWGGDYPSLINPSVYSFQEGSRGVFKPGVVREALGELEISKGVSPYCVWELGLVSHESAAWRKYLFSDHTGRDKNTYLNDLFRGPIGSKPAAFRGESMGKSLSGYEDDLGAPLVRRLEREGIVTVGDLMNTSERDLLAIRIVGPQTLKKINYFLSNDSPEKA